MEGENIKPMGIFSGKVFVVSGGSVSDNKRVKLKIEEYGGTVASRITKATDYYIVGDSRRSDTFDHKATKYQVPRLTEKFLNDCITSGVLIHDITPYFNTNIVDTPPRKHKKRKTDENGYITTKQEKIVLTEEQEKELYATIASMDKDSILNFLFHQLNKYPDEKINILRSITGADETHGYAPTIEM